jgi:hypothetical protein
MSASGSEGAKICENCPGNERKFGSTVQVISAEKGIMAR